MRIVFLTALKFTAMFCNIAWRGLLYSGGIEINCYLASGDPSTLRICVPYLCLAQWFSVLRFAVWRNRSRPSNQFAESAANGFAEPLATNSCPQCMRFLHLRKINSRPIKQLAQADSRTTNDSRLGTHLVWLIISSHIVEHIWYWTYSFGSMFLSNCFVMQSCFELEDALAGGSPGFMNPWGEARQSLCPSWQHGGGAWLTRQKPKRWNRFSQVLAIVVCFVVIYFSICGDMWGPLWATTPTCDAKTRKRQRLRRSLRWQKLSRQGEHYSKPTLDMWICMYKLYIYIQYTHNIAPPKKIGK